MSLFEAVFTARPNRYLIIAEINGIQVTAHCPNPGRLSEILFPGTRLLLSKEENLNRKTTRKTEYTAEAAIYENQIIPLYARKANDIARKCIFRVLFPGNPVIFPEYSSGASRFDFRILDGGREIFIEVKSCTLVHKGVAMFPDAPSSRALKHLNELALLAKQGKESIVIFVISHGSPERFMPNIHTDPEFSKMLAEYSNKIRIIAASVSLNRQLVPSLENMFVPVDFSGVPAAERNGGVYILILYLDHDIKLKPGSLKENIYKKGYYVYTGSAKKNLEQRTARHLRKKKKLNWHIDYLSVKAASAKAWPIYTDKNLECILAEETRMLADTVIPGFGSSDCLCKSHLAWFRENPEHNARFVHTLLDFRI